MSWRLFLQIIILMIVFALIASWLVFAHKRPIPGGDDE